MKKYYPLPVVYIIFMLHVNIICIIILFVYILYIIICNIIDNHPCFVRALTHAVD